MGKGLGIARRALGYALPNLLCLGILSLLFQDQRIGTRATLREQARSHGECHPCERNAKPNSVKRVQSCLQHFRDYGTRGTWNVANAVESASHQKQARQAMPAAPGNHLSV